MLLYHRARLKKKLEKGQWQKKLLKALLMEKGNKPSSKGNKPSSNYCSRRKKLFAFLYNVKDVLISTYSITLIDATDIKVMFFQKERLVARAKLLHNK
jgi:hypothetical protein